METKANYLLIGIFSVAGLLGSMVFLLWLAKVEVDRQYAYYFIRFDNVTGLAEAGDVRYNGLPVGRVVDLRLDPDDPSSVRVRVELAAETPVRRDTVATLQSQGVTGVSFVALSGGSAAAERLPEDSMIESRPSPLQSVLEGAPVLLQRAVDLLEDINEIASDENRSAVTQILTNLSSASARLDSALTDFERLSADLGTSASAIAGFTTRLDSLADTADVTLAAATETLAEGRAMIARGGAVLERADGTLIAVESGFASATALIEGDLARLVRQGAEAAATVDETLGALREPTLSALGSAQSTLSEAQASFAAANRVFDSDLGGMIEDVRLSVNAFRTTLTDASRNVERVSDEALLAAQSASRFAGVLEAVAVANEAQVSRFLRVGLPEFLGLTEEARQLVRNLDRFLDRVDRDPARYFLGTQGSEFSR